MADNVIPMGAADRVKAAAREAGIGPAEPLGPVIEAIADIPGEIDRALDQHAAEMAAMLKKHAAQMSEVSAQPQITMEEIQALNRAAARHAQSEMTHAACALVKHQVWTLSSIGAVAMVAWGLVCGGIGAAAVWASRPALTYQDQADGSQIAYFFTRDARPAAKSAPGGR